MALHKPPSLASLLKIAAEEDKPIALVLAGHNGSGPSQRRRSLAVEGGAIANS